MLFLKPWLATCFCAYEHCSSVFEKYFCHYLILIKHRLHVYICLLSFLTSIRIIIIKKRFRFFFQMHPYTFIFCYWQSSVIINRNLEMFYSSRTSLILICLIKHCSEPYKIKINEELPIKLEKQLKGKEVSIGDQKGNSSFYSDTVTSSIHKATAAENICNWIFF